MTKEKRRKGSVQLLDAREKWQPGGSEESKRSLGDKRRHMSSTDIAEIAQLYGKFADGENSKIFDNTAFGCTRVTVERPLRLRYQLTTEDKARFLDVCPQLLDDLQDIDKTFGRDPQRNWNAIWARIAELLQKRRSRWKPSEQRLFRTVFTQKDPAAEPVLNSDKGYEPDPDLRDFENIPLQEEVDAYFRREVLPHIPDAWMDRAKDKVGYEINFNSYFYRFSTPRPLADIDADLKRAEQEILRLVSEVAS